MADPTLSYAVVAFLGFALGVIITWVLFKTPKNGGNYGS
jgi:hypothetical protein